MESEETSGRITLKTVVTAPFKLIALPFKIIAAPVKGIVRVRRWRKGKKSAKAARLRDERFARMAPKLQDEVRRTRARFD